MHGAGNYSEDTSGAHLEYLQLLWRCDCYRTLLMSGLSGDTLHRAHIAIVTSV